MNNLKYIGLSLAIALSLGFSGCGGGGDDSSTDTSPMLIESVTTQTVLYQPYDFIGNNGIYYKTRGCRTGGLVDTHFEIYENGLIITAFNWKNNTYTSLCYVESVFENVELNNTSKLTKIDPSTIGITKYKPTDDYYNGTDSDLMETGHHSYNMDGGSSKPYSFEGYLYKYDDSGCDFGLGAYYNIYNDGMIIVTDDDGKTSSCVITKFFEYVELSNTTDVNASYVDNYTFYDNDSKIFYDIRYVRSGDYRLIEIINDGMNAVVDMGDGSTTTVQILDAYREINL